MNWKYVKQLKSQNYIEDFEHKINYTFPASFKECVKEYNGGKPDYRSFNTDKSENREIKSFLSFNPEDRESIWKVYDWNIDLTNNSFIPFAIDNFGNLICFGKNTDNIVFINHETADTEYVAKDFSIFLNSLY